MKRVAFVLALLIIGCTSSFKRTPVRDTEYAGPGGALHGVVTEYDGPPLPGVTVVLHTSSGDLTQVSDIRGHYWFMNVPPGTYIVREMIPPGATQTLPGANALPTPFAYSVVVLPGQTPTGIDFGDTLALVLHRHIPVS